MDSMQMFDQLFLYIGIAAVCLGVYMLLTNKLVGRKLKDASAEQTQMFIKLDSVTYILLGGLSILMGETSKIPFLQNTWVQIGMIVLTLVIVFLNYYLGKKIYEKY